MEKEHLIISKMTTISNFFFETWVYITGRAEWTRKQVFIGYIYMLLFPLSVLGYACFAQLNWSWIQMLAAGLIAFDLSAGLIGYNHKSIKVRQAKEKGKLQYFHHNLQHIHPLVLIFFNNSQMLLGITIYWMLTSSAYVSLLTYNAKTGTRILGSKAKQMAAIVYEIVAAIVIVSLSFFAAEVSSEFQIYGITAYIALPFLTFILINVPIAAQRTLAMAMVMSMVMVSMYIGVPQGFIWLYPIYYLKLLAGFSAREELNTIIV